jgi:hypothetical protein
MMPCFFIMISCKHNSVVDIFFCVNHFFFVFYMF